MSSIDISIFFIPYGIKQNQSKLLDKLYVVICILQMVSLMVRQNHFVFSPDSFTVTYSNIYPGSESSVNSQPMLYVTETNLYAIETIHRF